MKKADIVNLIKYHYESDNEKFHEQAFAIAKDFKNNGDDVLAEHIASIISSKYGLIPQGDGGSSFFEEIDTHMGNHLFLPEELSNDITGLIHAISSGNGVAKFLFSGNPGTGKTETAKYVANVTGRKLYSINFTSLVDARLGETPKNIERLFAAMNHVYDLSTCIFLFDEIDVIALDRINKNDIREMGRVTSLFIKCLDRVDANAVIIATTNLGNNLDRAIKRRFDYELDFNCYSKETLADIAVAIIKELSNEVNEADGLRFVKKMVEHSIRDFSPAELRNIIRIALAFANPNDKNDFYRRLFVKLYSEEYLGDLDFLRNYLNMTVREMERVAGISKSSLARKISNGGGNK